MPLAHLAPAPVLHRLLLVMTLGPCLPVLQPSQRLVVTPALAAFIALRSAVAVHPWVEWASNRFLFANLDGLLAQKLPSLPHFFNQILVLIVV